MRAPRRFATRSLASSARSRVCRRSRSGSSANCSACWRWRLRAGRCCVLHRHGADEQRIANVDGTRNAVQFTETIRTGCFHHVSSIAAAGLYEGVFRAAQGKKGGEPQALTPEQMAFAQLTQGIHW